MAIPDWFLNEVDFAGAEHLDPGYVPNYDDKARTDPTDDLNALLALGMNSSSTLVDFGAGTGTFALAAAPHCRRVVAVDVSPVMLAALRQKAGQQNVRNIECVQRGFLSYEHDGEAADFVYSRHALHHLPDFWKALALSRIAAILKPGGVLYLRDLIFSFEPQQAESFIGAWLGRASTQAGIGWSRDELVTHLRDEYSPFSWLLEPMIERAGFSIQQAKHDASGIYSTYTCIRA